MNCKNPGKLIRSHHAILLIARWAVIKIARICFIVSGILLILDSTLMILNKPNPLGLPLPCPITLIILGIGLITFAAAKK
jgi:hypothetical protein